MGNEMTTKQAAPATPLAALELAVRSRSSLEADNRDLLAALKAMTEQTEVLNAQQAFGRDYETARALLRQIEGDK
jgi:hypothetical protein